MVTTDVCYLIADDPSAHGAFAPHVETRRMVYCAIKSVGMQETYRAMDHDLRPNFVVVLADPVEYQHERQLEHKGVRYDIIRTYITERHTVELTVEEARHA